MTPSIVTDDSATFVDRMILRRSPGRTARACSSSGISPCSGSTAKAAMPGSSASAVCARLISPAPGRNTSRSPSLSSRRNRRTAPATCAASGRSSGVGRCSIATSNIRPSLRTTSPPTKSATGSASNVADIATTARSGRSVSRSRRNQARARSVATWRSCSSSSTTTPTPGRRGAASMRRMNSPSVMNRSRVLGPAASSKRTE